MKTYAYTDVGRQRKENQDSVFISDDPIGNLPNLYIVADGMGGHAGGRYASNCAVTTVTQAIMEESIKEPVQILEHAIQSANQQILEEAATLEHMSGMGTTIVASTIVNNVLYAANVGDSRLYIVNENRIRQITKDHSLVEEMIRIGEIDRENAKHHPDKNVITRAVGAMDDLKIDFFEIPISKGDIILMCSDGLSNMVEDSQMVSILNNSSNVKGKVEQLVQVANENGGEDNITVIVIES